MRPFYGQILVLWMTLVSLVKTLIHQRLGVALLLVAVLLLIAVFFSFLGFAPILSPFVYPLF